MGTWIAAGDQKAAYPRAWAGVGTAPWLCWGAASTLTQQVRCFPWSGVFSGVVFFGSLPPHFWLHQTCLTPEIRLLSHMATGAPIFVNLWRKAIICSHLWTSQLFQCFCLLPCILSLSFSVPVLCNTYLSFLIHMFFLPTLLCSFCVFHYCLSTCLSLFICKGIRGRSLVFAYLNLKITWKYIGRNG